MYLEAVEKAVRACGHLHWLSRLRQPKLRHQPEEGLVAERPEVGTTRVLVETGDGVAQVRHVPTGREAEGKVVVWLATDGGLGSGIDEDRGEVGAEEIRGAVAGVEAGKELLWASRGIPDDHSAGKHRQGQVGEVGEDNGKEGALGDGLLGVLEDGREGGLGEGSYVGRVER